MANPERGQVALTVGDRTYTLVTDMDAICQVEALMSAAEGRVVPYVEVVLGAAQHSQRHVRAIVWGALRQHHEDITLEQAGGLIVQAGGSEKLLETLRKLRKASEAEGDGRPRKARQGGPTGARISNMPNGSASAKTSSGG